MIDEEKMSQDAAEFARQNKKEIVRKIIETSPFSEKPISIFMAGSPGAGKTEFSISFLQEIQTQILRIDPDELRKFFPGYTGNNAHIFQGGISIITDFLQDEVLRKGISFLMDGTFSNFEISAKNIDRSLKRGREVTIIYIYQDPETAWDFTKKREIVEGRRITKEMFINGFLRSADTVTKIKEKYGEKVKIYLVKKRFKQPNIQDIVNFKDVENVIDFVGLWYNEKQIRELIN
jgi:UDP-N-acetylglucosamine kinase